MSSLASPYFASLRHRPRLLGALALAVVVYIAILPFDFRAATQALIAWNAGAWTFLALIAHMMTAGQGRARPDAAAEDEGQLALLIIAVVAAAAAIAAILAELGPVKNMEGLRKGVHLALVAGTVLSAWAFIHVSFALHYAGAYFSGEDGGLNFPNCSEPGWGEFAYQAFVLGCACATADVNVTTGEMRRIVLAHGIVSFVFNTVILALTINIAAGFV